MTEPTEQIVTIEELDAMIEEAEQRVHRAGMASDKVEIARADAALAGTDQTEAGRLSWEADRALRLAHQEVAALREARRRLRNGTTASVSIRTGVSRET